MLSPLLITSKSQTCSSCCRPKILTALKHGILLVLVAPASGPYRYDIDQESRKLRMLVSTIDIRCLHFLEAHGHPAFEAVDTVAHNLSSLESTNLDLAASRGVLMAMGDRVLQVMEQAMPCFRVHPGRLNTKLAAMVSNSSIAQTKKIADVENVSKHHFMSDFEAESNAGLEEAPSPAQLRLSRRPSDALLEAKKQPSGQTDELKESPKSV